MTKDYIEAIFDLIIHKHNSDRDVIVSNMSELSKALDFCPDRHMGELNLIYSVLSGKISTENYNFETFSVDSYIKNCVANLKEKLLESAVTSLNAKQNVHVLNYWKCKLSDELGLSFDFETNMGTFDQDKFDGEEGNALQAFYSFFTPDYVINEITSEINQNISIQRYVISEILNDEQLSEEKKVSFYSNVDEQNIFSNNYKVEPEFIKYKLIKMGIIIKNTERGSQKLS